MAHPKEVKDRMIAFITANYRHLTLNDLTEELADLGANYHVVREICGKLGVKPITITEQSKKFILEFYERKTAADLAKNLNVCEAYVLRICKSLNVIPLKRARIAEEVAPPPPPKSVQKTKSAGKILSEFKMANAPHYFSLTHYLASLKNKRDIKGISENDIGTEETARLYI